MAMLLALLDTGAGKQFIREELLPSDTVRSVRKENVPIMRDANKNILSLRGTARLEIQLGP